MPLDWFHRMFPSEWRRLGKAPKNCPKCGKRMVTRTVYYECRGCGYVQNTPRAKRRKDIQPVDGLTPALDRGISSGAESWQSEFALATVPTQMATEFRWLCGTGFTLFYFLLLGWGGFIWIGSADHEMGLFKALWSMCILGQLMLCVVLFHSARMLKQVGIVLALILAVLLVVTGYQVPQGLIAPWDNTSNYSDMAENWLFLKIFFVAAAHCVWIAFFLERERRY
jgi:hypothetical protein